MGSSLVRQLTGAICFHQAAATGCAYKTSASALNFSFIADRARNTENHERLFLAKSQARNGCVGVVGEADSIYTVG